MLFVAVHSFVSILTPTPAVYLYTTSLGAHRISLSLSAIMGRTTNKTNKNLSNICFAYTMYVCMYVRTATIER